MAEPTILIDKRGGATHLTLNRPDKLNSFDRQMRRELMVALEEAGSDESCRAVLFTGASTFTTSASLSANIWPGALHFPAVRIR